MTRIAVVVMDLPLLASQLSASDQPPAIAFQGLPTPPGVRVQAWIISSRQAVCQRSLRICRQAFPAMTAAGFVSRRSLAACTSGGQRLSS
jgi:hypothetical protein